MCFIFKFIILYAFIWNSGILGFGLVTAYGLYRFKNRKGRTSLYLIQLRLAAQGTAVGIIGIGVLYNIFNEVISKKSWNNTYDLLVKCFTY